jgi:predicted RNase H-like HicB family nuclease
VADYQFNLTAQAWRRDSYYVASSQPIRELQIVASTEDEARTEAHRVLGEIDSSWYWRIRVQSMKDVRLLS